MTDSHDESAGVWQADAVRPLDEAGTPLDTPPPPEPTTRSPWLIAAGAAAAVLLIGVVGGWLWWVNVIRGPQGAAEVIPGSADVVFTVDALELIEGDRFNRLVRSFDSEFDFDDLLTEIDDEIERGTGLRVLEDVRAWIGRSAAVAVWIPDDFFTTFDGEPEVAMAVMTRNEGAARRFLDDMIAAARDDGAEVTTITVAAVEVYSVAAETPTLVTVHSGRMLLATDPDRLAQMIEPTDPITERSAYDRLWAAANGDAAFASMYISENFFDEVLTGIAEAGGIESADVPSGALLATAALDDDGVEFAAASIALDDAGQVSPGSWAAALPAGTYGYFSVALPFDEEEIEALLDEQLAVLQGAGGGDDVDAFLDEFEGAFGVSLRELVSQFGGEVLFAAIQSDFGPLPALAGGPLGVGFAMGVEDESVVSDALASLPEVLGPDGDVIRLTANGLWAVDPGDGELVHYGVAEGRLVVASDDVTIDALLGRGSGGLVDDPEWERLAGLIGDDMLMYVDLARIISTFAPPDEAVDLAPLRSLGASAILEDGVSLVRMRLVIDY
jgi:hypothetical protein